MSERPLVSVITGTWRRHELVLGLIESIRAQTYRPLEHVIVSDGPDDELDGLITWAMFDQTQPTSSGKLIPDERVVPIVYQELGFHASGFFSMSVSAPPFLVASLLAHGPLQMWASDDERFEPDHVEALVDLLEEKDADWVAPKIACYEPGAEARPIIIGTDPPERGQVSHALYRRELLDYRSFRLHIGSGTDWDQAAAWARAGARFALLDRVTMRHRVDKAGEGPDMADVVGQPLRGLGGRSPFVGRRWRGYPLGEDGRLLTDRRRYLHPDDHRGDDP